MMKQTLFRHCSYSIRRHFSTEPPPVVERTSLQLFRDCMRLVRHVAPGHTAKSMALRTMVRSQFDAGKQATDPQKVQDLKAGAVRALANYMLFQSGSQDAQLSKAMDKFHEQSVEKANKRGDDNNR